jgi:hypothetical protein
MVGAGYRRALVDPTRALPSAQRAADRSRQADFRGLTTGFGSFYDGVAHLWLAPVDLLLVVAIALLAGQRGTQAARWSRSMARCLRCGSPAAGSRRRSC